jgi:pimeloyl-ACP methyl ester carboxylesterase
MPNDRQLTLNDGTRIAYRVEGDGPPFVLTNGLTTTTTFWKYLRPIWSREHRVVTWDLPGHGRSGPAESAMTATIEAQPSIVRAVMNAVGIEHACQIGWSTGTQVVLELYRQFPQRCDRLVL